MDDPFFLMSALLPASTMSLILLLRVIVPVELKLDDSTLCLVGDGAGLFYPAEILCFLRAS